jgi:predicted small secreted protein
MSIDRPTPSPARRSFAVRAAAAALALAAFTLAGCQTTQGRDAKPSGFLGDYSQLREGQGDEALLVYVDQAANWSQYRKIRLDPITVYANDDLADVPPEQLQTLVNLLDARVREELKADYEFTDATGPDVLRMRIAITEAAGSKVVLDILSTIVPAGRVIAESKQFIAGTGTFTGRAGVEAEILDSTTGERLFAAVDRRVGRKSVGGVFSKWDDVETAYDLWAEKLRTRLADWRAGRP